MRVCLRVRELLDARGMGVDDLARLTGMDPQTARSVYDGQPTEMDLTTQGHIAQALGVRPDEILGEVQEEQPSVLDLQEEQGRDLDVQEMPRDESVPLATGHDPDRPGAL